MPRIPVAEIQAIIDRRAGEVTRYNGVKWTKSHQPMVNAEGDIAWYRDGTAMVLYANGTMAVISDRYMVISKPYETPKAYYKGSSLSYFSERSYELVQHRTLIDGKWYYLPTMVVHDAGTYGVYDDITVIRPFIAPGLAFFTVINNGVKKEYSLPNGSLIHSATMEQAEPLINKFLKAPVGPVAENRPMSVQEKMLFNTLIAVYSNPHKITPQLNYYAYF